MPCFRTWRTFSGYRKTIRKLPGSPGASACTRGSTSSSSSLINSKRSPTRLRLPIRRMRMMLTKASIDPPRSGESIRQRPTSPLGLAPKTRSSINTPTPETEMSAAGRRSVFPPMLSDISPCRRTRGDLRRSFTIAVRSGFTGSHFHMGSRLRYRSPEEKQEGIQVAR